MRRPSWDQYFHEMLSVVAKRATCNRGRSGCVIVKDRRILATGYVGSPPGMAHCDDVGHLMRTVIDDEGNEREHCVRTVHAEQNAIAQAARYGIGLEGSTIYCTMEPCMTCAMLIVSVGATRVVAAHQYHAGAKSRELLKEASVELVVLDGLVLEYDRASQP